MVPTLGAEAQSLLGAPPSRAGYNLSRASRASLAAGKGGNLKNRLDECPEVWLCTSHCSLVPKSTGNEMVQTQEKACTAFTGDQLTCQKICLLIWIVNC